MYEAIFQFMFDPANAWIVAPLAVLVNVGLVFLGVAGARRRRLQTRVREAARSLGLSARKGEASGSVDGVPVAIRVVSGDDEGAGGDEELWMWAGGLAVFVLLGQLVWRAGGIFVRGTARSGRPLGVVRVTAPCEVDPGVTIRPAHRLLADRAPSHATGDPALDRVAQVSGPPLVALGLLDAPARAALVELVTAGGGVDDGQVRLDHHSGARHEIAAMDDLEDQVRVVARAAGCLASRVPPLDALVRRVRHDPSPEVRVHALEALLLHAPEAVHTRVLVADLLDSGGADPSLVQRATVARLAQVGRGADVPTLRAMDAPPGSVLAQLVEAAVLRIQERVGPGAVGGLTLEEAGAGGLTVVPTAGGLTVAPTDDA